MANSPKKNLKVIVLGDTGVGKTALIDRYVKQCFSHNFAATIALDYTIKEIFINDQLVKLALWDTPGLENLKSVGVSLYRGADCCVLVYDVTMRNSFKNLEWWHESFLKNASPDNAANFPFILIGNKMDMANRQIFKDEALEWCKSKNNMPYFEISARDGRNVNEAFEALAKHTIGIRGFLSFMSNPPKPILKIVVLGDSSVGKTALINRYVNQYFSGNYKATIGTDLATKEILINDQIVRLQIWDTAGRERFQSLGVSFYRGADCCLLVYDVTTRCSFRNLESWYEDFVIHASPDNPANFPFVLIGNKVDLENRQVFTDNAQDWCKLKNFIPYFETSAIDGRNVNEAFEALAKNTMAMRKQPLTYIFPNDSIILDKNTRNKEKCNC